MHKDFLKEIHIFFLIPASGTASGKESELAALSESEI
jgi:hypothetical protein